MTLCILAAVAAALAAYLSASLGWTLLATLASFLVCFGALGLAVFAAKSGKLFLGLGTTAAFLAGVFTALMQGSLWTFVWVFLVADVVLILLAFLLLVLICAMVDLDKPQAEEDSPFYRAVMHICIEALIHLVMVRLTTRGLEKTPKDGRFLLVCNHLEIADPGILLHCFSKSQLAFITKYENMTMFIVNKFMHKILCQPIVREDDRQGLKVILKCIQLIKEDKVSIGVFPEGWITLDGRIRHFRPGVFKIAQKANVPIVVCTLRGTQNLFPNLKKLRPTPVEMHLVDVIPAEDMKGRTTTDISNQVYEMMIADLGEEFRALETENT